MTSVFVKAEKKKHNRAATLIKRRLGGGYICIDEEGCSTPNAQ